MVDGTSVLSTSTSIRSLIVSMTAVWVALPVLPSRSPSTPTVLVRISSSGPWSVAVVTTNGMVACAPGLIEPVNLTLNPVTGSHEAGGAGSVFGAVASIGAIAVPSHTYVIDAPVAPSGHTTPLPAGDPIDVNASPPSDRWFGVPGAGSVIVIESSGSADSLVPLSVTVLVSPACTTFGSKDLPAETSTSFGGIR